MSTDKPLTLKSKIKNFWLKHEAKVILIIGFILVAAVSYEAGILKGQKWEQKPLIIEKPAEISENKASEVDNIVKKDENQAVNSQSNQNIPSQTQNLAQEALKTTQIDTNTPQTCAFVGSKNSTKYHLPTCQWAKRIKPENQVCFGSAEEAKSKGYTPCGTCIK